MAVKIKVHKNENNADDRVHQYSFDFLVTENISMREIEARITAQLEDVGIDGVEFVNGGLTDASWSKKEYGLSEASRGFGEAKGKGGMYTFDWTEYTGFGRGRMRAAALNAKDDRTALRKFISKNDSLGPIFNELIILPDEKEKQQLLDSGEYEDGDWFDSMDEVISYLSENNGDGCDLIHYIKRPDGSMLFEDEEVDVEDWD